MAFMLRNRMELISVILADLIDYLPIPFYGTLGTFPVLGDVLDVISTVSLASIGGVWYFLGSIELLGLDILPTFTIVYYFKNYLLGKGRSEVD